MHSVRTAVIPVAGLGTRLLPASKAIPKEMIPVVDKPVIQYVVEEAVAAGIERIVLVTRNGKEAIENHFDSHFELEQQLEQKGKTRLLESVRGVLPAHVEMVAVRQPRAAGLGDAIRRAAPVIGNEAFAVMLPDVLLSTAREAAWNMRAMLDAYAATGEAQILVEEVPAAQVDQYGIVDCDGARLRAGTSARICGMVEKPARGTEPSRLSIVGRYVLPNPVLDLLASTQPGAGGEIQLTDALRALLSDSGARALMMRGRTYDCGNKLGYAKACLAMALQDADIAQELGEFAFALLASNSGSKGHRLAILRDVA